MKPMVNSPEELLKKAEKWNALASPMHRFYSGKVEVMPKCSIQTLDDFSIW
jgi:hypothetical protein